MHRPAAPAPFERRRAVLAVAAALLAVTAATGCGDGRGGVPATDHSPGDRQGRSAGRVQPPPLHAGFDYQIGGGYAPPSGVRVVSRDRGAKPAAGLYNVCYVNAFQAQPGALDDWERRHPELLLRGKDGQPVRDREWNEALFDTATASHREALARIVGRWIDGCAEAGYQAVELDNLDSYERSGGRLDHKDNAEFAALLTRRAHRAGLAAGQKNAAELLSRHRTTGFDFAVTEECGQYDECGQYATTYHDRVLDVEYTGKGFAAACHRWGKRLSVVRRDLDVLPRGEEGHVSKRC